MAKPPLRFFHAVFPHRGANPFSGLSPGFEVAVANRQNIRATELFCGPNLLRLAFVRLNCDHEIDYLVSPIVNLAHIHR